MKFGFFRYNIADKWDFTKTMKKIFACATSCYGNLVDLNRVLIDIASSGFTGVEFMSIPEWFDHLSPDLFLEQELKYFVSSARQLGLATPALCAHCELGKPVGASQLIARIRLAASMNIKLVVTGSGKLENKEAERLFYQGLEDAIQTAEKESVVLLLETGGTYHPTGEAVKKITDKFASESLKIAYDPANVALWGKINPVIDLQKVIEDVKHFHVKDYQPGFASHPPLGKGTIDFNSIFSSLKKSAYSGAFSLEVDLGQGDFAAAHANVIESSSYLQGQTNFLCVFAND